ncbi:MAG TPA: hypothetical protein VJT84_04015 [Gaiellaceae bacterium]|nr:hypothetical protein [Gaiellaceae bacterium]
MPRARFLHAGARVRRPSSRRIDFHLHRSRPRDIGPVGAPTTAGSTHDNADEQAYVLTLSLGQLALLYKSLQAVRTLGALPRQDEVLNDTIQLVDQALETRI